MNVLLISVSTGAGHVRAAEAVEAAIHQDHPKVKASHINAMNYVSAPFRRVYESGYSFLVTRTPALWGSVYSLTDRSMPAAPMHFINSIQSANAEALLDCIERFQPDRILTTHFLLPQILSERMKRIKIPLECVITDYDLHRYWVNPIISHYYAANEPLSYKLMKQGVPERKITVSGIPIDPVFLETVDRPSVLSRLRLRSDIPTLLALSGGMGFGPLEKTVQALFGLNRNVQLITVSGKNEVLRTRLNRLIPPPCVSMVNLGYVSNMHELLGASDIVITKGGGLTISECLAKGAATIVFSPIPGQEEKNAEYLYRKGAGIKVDNVDELVARLKEFLRYPETLETYRRRARACAKPRAAFTVADHFLRARSAA